LSGDFFSFAILITRFDSRPGDYCPDRIVMALVKAATVRILVGFIWLRIGTGYGLL
jgi:hypothetical protein